MTASEVTAKLLLSLPVLAILVFIWRSEIDLSRLRAQRLAAWVSIREPDAVYQDGRIVGRVDGVQVRQQDRLVTFRTIRQTGPLAMGQPFVFRTLALQPRAIEGIGTGPAGPAGGDRVLEGVTCEILGPG